MLALGFAFIFIQVSRKELTYRMRLVSSGISLSLAGYLIVMGVMHVFTGIQSYIIVSLFGFLVAYRLIRTDLKTWRWFREKSSMA